MDIDKTTKPPNIYVELESYKFFHSPTQIEKLDTRFIGRSKLIQKIKDLTIKSSVNTGAYLITGYRGAGKSTLNQPGTALLTPHIHSSKLYQKIRFENTLFRQA